ncbi:DUF2501 domain-containing protein [Pseudoxanthomonas sp. GM95]|uniref:DUF2501 domain-containing protein n=1 Tax=Pseudoxanthomonas sp. GM95 TaxID=1881043 RepID=UPI0015873D48|nr:DUF2501 domain-containing protein [Pseudoxanthomonas sp. GM95]
MTSNLLRTSVLIAALGVCATAQAQSFKDMLKSQQSSQSTQSSGQGSSALGALGGLSMPAMSGNTAGNAAGVLQYCVQRKYLSANAVTSVKDKLMSKYGLGSPQQAEQSPDYKSGAMGLLKGDGGKSFNLESVSGKVKDKACDYVLDNATKLI